MISNTKAILQNYKTVTRKKANDHKHKGHITKRREERKQMITNTKSILQSGEMRESK